MPEADVVLVHSPFLGPSTWRPAAEQLAAAGRHVLVPSLIEAVGDLVPRYDALADTVVAAVADGVPDGAALVVHSGAGPVVPSIVDRAPWPVHAVVFVDATLPHPGRAWLDTAPAELTERLRGLAGPDELLPPWHEWFPAEMVSELLPDARLRAVMTEENPRVRLSYLEEVAPVLAAWEDRPAGYVRLSAAYDDAAAEARRRGWPVVRHDADHLSLMTRPAAGASAVLAVLDQLESEA